MRNEFAVSLGVLLVLANSGLTQDVEPVPVPETSRNLLSDVPNPGKTEAIVDHIVKAAEHLEAAGRVEEAAKLRDEAKRISIREDLLGRKEAELECLQQEVDRLRARFGQSSTVLLEFAMVEIDRGKLGLKMREFDRLVGRAGLSAISPGSAVVGVAAANPLKLPPLREFREKGTLRVLGEANVATANRTTARYLSGGDQAVRLANADGEESLGTAWHGTRIEVTPALLTKQQVQLDIDFEVRSRHVGQDSEEEPIDAPAFASNRVHTRVRMELGQTLALFTVPTRWDRFGHPVRKSGQTGGDGPDDSSNPLETLVFVTPRLLNPPQAAPVIPVAADGDLPVLPENFAPDDWSVFGPPIPVLKRRTVRD